MSFQQIINSINDACKDERSKYHLTLGCLIEELKKADQDLRVIENHTSKGVSSPHSYRGYYSDLALERSDEVNSVRDLLSKLLNVQDQELTGYKGGEFLMTDDTPLWISEYGNSSGIAIISTKIERDVFYLVTKELK
jgi:hypothetical protein